MIKKYKPNAWRCCKDGLKYSVQFCWHKIMGLSSTFEIKTGLLHKKFMHAGPYQKVSVNDGFAECSNKDIQDNISLKDSHFFQLWKRQFEDALMVLLYFNLYM